MTLGRRMDPQIGPSDCQYDGPANLRDRIAGSRRKVGGDGEFSAAQQHRYCRSDESV